MGRRSRAREEELRASLAPVESGEVPVAIKIAAGVAIVIALSNLALLFMDFEVQGKQPKRPGVVAFSALMLVAAVFMLRKSYWAVLGFQALLALTCIVAGLSLLVASNVQAVLLCVGTLLAAGTLFWFLVRAMARLQMPERPGKVTRHG